jgi:hypothetical protein
MICLITASSSLVPNSFSIVNFEAPSKLPWAPCLRGCQYGMPLRMWCCGLDRAGEVRGMGEAEGRLTCA